MARKAMCFIEWSLLICDLGCRRKYIAVIVLLAFELVLSRNLVLELIGY